MTPRRRDGSIPRGLLAGDGMCVLAASVAGLSPGPARVAAGSAGAAPPCPRQRKGRGEGVPAGVRSHEPSSERSCYLDALPKSDLRPDATSIVRPCGATRTAAALSPLGLQRGRRRREARHPAPRRDKRRAGDAFRPRGRREAASVRSRTHASAHAQHARARRTAARPANPSVNQLRARLSRALSLRN